jgi:hypothetical protein
LWYRELEEQAKKRGFLGREEVRCPLTKSANEANKSLIFNKRIARLLQCVNMAKPQKLTANFDIVLIIKALIKIVIPRTTIGAASVRAWQTHPCDLLVGFTPGAKLNSIMVLFWLMGADASFRTLGTRRLRGRVRYVASLDQRIREGGVACSVAGDGEAQLAAAVGGDEDIAATAGGGRRRS